MQSACLVKLVRGGSRSRHEKSTPADGRQCLLVCKPPQTNSQQQIKPVAAHHYLGRAEKLQFTRSQICIDQTPMVILPHQVLDFQLYIAQYDSR